MNHYTLPDLPYDYSALEPHVSGKIMELHHGKHHAAYVKNANSVLEQLDEARQKDDFARLAALERALAFNLSGHILHCIFWKNMTPKGGGTPQGDFAAPFKEISAVPSVSQAAHGSGFDDHGLRLGRAGLGTHWKKTADHTDLRSPVQPRPSWCSTDGCRCLGTRLLTSVPESQD